MTKHNAYKVGILATHPIQYYSPLYKTLSIHPDINLDVFYCHNQSKVDQSRGGFNVEFDWDIDLLDGFSYKFLKNISKQPSVFSFFGCDTPEIKEIILNSNFDAFIVQGWYLKSFWQAMYACWKSGTPIFVRGDSQLNTNRSLIKKFIKYPIYRYFMRKFDACLAVGERSKKYYSHYGVNKEKIIFTPHCVDNNFFESRVEKNKKNLTSLKEKYKLPNDSIVFLFIGKFITKKRPLDFIEAIKIASKINKNIYGLMVGDGELRSEIENIIKLNDINIQLTGFINQTSLPEIYSITDFIVLPSDSNETWGLVVNEAMSSGVPAIVSIEAGCSEDLIKKDITGNIFSCGDVKELKDIIVKYSNNTELTAFMKQNVKKHISKYSLDATVEGFINALKAIKHKSI